jgi:hypothetical protein
MDNERSKQALVALGIYELTYLGQYEGFTTGAVKAFVKNKDKFSQYHKNIFITNATQAFWHHPEQMDEINPEYLEELLNVESECYFLVSSWNITQLASSMPPYCLATALPKFFAKKCFCPAPPEQWVHDLDRCNANIIIATLLFMRAQQPELFESIEAFATPGSKVQLAIEELETGGLREESARSLNDLQNRAHGLESRIAAAKARGDIGELNALQIELINLRREVVSCIFYPTPEIVGIFRSLMQQLYKLLQAIVLLIFNLQQNDRCDKQQDGHCVDDSKVEGHEAKVDTSELREPSVFEYDMSEVDLEQ